MAHCKDTYTFLHDANARNDAKMKQFRVKYGPEAYAFYFMVIEMMREEPTYTLNMQYVDGYAHDLGLAVERFTELLRAAESMGLLSMEGENIVSSAFKRRMAAYDLKRERLRQNALSKTRKEANAEHLQSSCNATVYGEQEPEQVQDLKILKKRQAPKPKPVEAFKLPDRSGNERKPHPIFPSLWFSEREIAWLERHFQERGLKPQFWKTAYRVVDTWFSEGINGQKAYKTSACHAKRVERIGITEALKEQVAAQKAVSFGGQVDSIYARRAEAKRK